MDMVCQVGVELLFRSLFNHENNFYANKKSPRALRRVGMFEVALGRLAGFVLLVVLAGMSQKVAQLLGRVACGGGEGEFVMNFPSWLVRSLEEALETWHEAVDDPAYVDGAFEGACHHWS
jgi:hypothetical protein